MAWDSYWSATWWGPGVELRVYQRQAPSTLIGTVEQRWDVGWLDELTEVGSGQFTIAHDAPSVVANPSILDAGNIVRIHDLSAQKDRFAWTIKQKRRIRGDSHDEVKVFGPGVLDILRYADVYPEYWPSELVADTRMFGFMSSDYVEDASWIAPSSRGTQGSRPFGDTRPEGWSDSAAEFIADSTIAENREGWFWLRAQLVVPERMDVRFEATADEAFELYVAGIPLLNSALDGEYQWATTYHKTLELPAGTYQVAAKVWHPDRPSAGTNLRWFIFSAMAAGESGAPAAQKEAQEITLTAGMDEVQEVYNDATGGSFTLTLSGEETSSIAYNATPAVVKSALEALPSVTNVAVSGSGNLTDPWTIQFVDPGKTNLATMTANDINLTGHTNGTTIRAYDGGNGGQFILTFAGDTTALIAYNASAATVATELNALPSITDAGGVTVTGSGTTAEPWVVTFGGYGNQPTISVDATALHGHELQRVHNNSTSGTFTLTFNGQTTSNIAYNATAATVETELQALSNIEDVTVTGSGTAADPWAVEFVDPDGDVAQMTANDAGMNGTSTIKTLRSGYTATGSVIATTDGSLPDVLLRSSTTGWKVLPLGSAEPGMTPGEILQVLLSGAQSRGWAPSVTYDFTAAADTDGTAWKEIEFAAQVGNDSILTVAHRLGDLGIDVAMSPTLKMSAWSTRGSSLAATVTLAAADCSKIDCNYEDEIINTVLLRTKQAWYEAPTAAPASDRWEGFLSFGELTSEAAARDIAEAVMNTYNDPREIVTFTWPTELGPEPYVHFNVGDTITAPGWTTPAAQTIAGRATRILSIAAQETEAGTIEWTAEGEQ